MFESRRRGFLANPQSRLLNVGNPDGHGELHESTSLGSKFLFGDV